MPSSEIMTDFKRGTLHSGKKVKGKKRKIVKNPKQAKAILLSYLRKENRIGPRKDKIVKKVSRKKISVSK
jgi:integrase